MPAGYKTLKVETVGETKWLKLESLTYVDKDGKERVWDRVVRSTPKTTEGVDASMIVATLRKDHAEYLVTVVQYRPAIEAFCLEFPAGLVNADEDIADCARREFQEETGYSAGPDELVSETLCLSPGMSTESVQMVQLKVPDNHPPPVQALDDGEDIEVVLLPMADLLPSIQHYCKTHNVVCFHGLYAFALGLSLRTD
ncbi:nudix family hydrolase [Gregarina niphandrodes]|uniref:Nudix family hydrolase n=1 Tax=Gregarina niphandrodes TaxID=110365 RepID=A0A023B876_GRENI|nr:nudix family hydrolase [Gregarina niphandrodes]EZG68183.1 nudix family hydrolase [Gregarina niphandrodes]|eukprot:XP_011130077.1 nudix family hydrolase [Gregarina niphandrodes]